MRAASYIQSYKQRGAVLFMVMLFMVLLSLLAAAGYGIAYNQQRGARGSLDRELAAQAAEAAMRDAELNIQCQKWTGGTLLYTATDGITPGTLHCLAGKELCEQGAGTGITDTCAGGFVNAKTFLGSTVPYTPNDINGANCSVNYGSYSGASINWTAAAPTGRGLAQAPRYMVELVQYRPAGGKSAIPVYRIRAEGFGRSADVRVLLEGVFKPCG